MSIKLGPALKIYNSILMFKHATDRGPTCAQDGSQAPDGDRSQSDGADRNQFHAGDT